MNEISSLGQPRWLSFPQHGVSPFDPLLLGSALALVLTGFVMITSASMDVAAEKFGGPFFFAQRHGIFIILALIASIIVVRIPIKYWEKYGPILLGVGFVLLLLVLIPGIGKEVNGSQRWIRLGPLNLQASEIAKFCMVIYVAGYLVRRLSEVRTSWGGVVKPVLPLAFFVSLLLGEPDYGAAVVLMGTVMGMIFLGGMRFTQFIMVLSCAVGLIMMMAVAQPYRMARLKSFQDPWADPFGSGYQLSQAQIAFGRGEWFGTGLGNSVQKLFYLPEAHTDFVYSVLAEEFGLIGALLVVVLYAVMICRIFLIGRQAEKQKQFFMGYVAYGFGLVFAAQALINIGVNVGALPTKGLTLPLLSYGGSSLLVCAAMIAIIIRIDFELKRLRAANNVEVCKSEATNTKQKKSKASVKKLSSQKQVEEKLGHA
ncbi:putative lipid II flippase FtsW [Neptunomonas japonica]|uniref:Probable peptidoglycan glycosyltransferase FtsW n=1 Tax=Neptunomonas japonica JAMM 1380 TaxID=1441457 RepID=A0A7R6SV02_9GAMM|nr:putative lipid II flippase FtsW [Neptunomonas japonica]BBB28915.1 cell division protein FtsW [Neptunomonas japonica JAMM 1380]